MQMYTGYYMSRPIEPAELIGAIVRILERTARRRSLDSSKVLERMEEVLKRIEKLEVSLAK